METKQKTTLTQGSVAKGMLLFALPIFVSNLFQQLYNAADSLIVGNFLGGEALAAVGSSGSLIFLLTGFVNGVSLGAWPAQGGRSDSGHAAAGALLHSYRAAGAAPVPGHCGR